MSKQSFASDNYSGVHPDILSHLSATATEYHSAYGYDTYTQQLQDTVQRLLGSTDLRAYPLMTGTGANVSGIKQLLKPYQAVIASDFSHIHVDETGSLEALSGQKILTLAHHQGKINIQEADAILEAHNSEHQVMPKLVSITCPTELGTVYTLDELRQIRAYCSQHNLYLHIDGARLSNALVSWGISLKEFYILAQPDILSFGGTKNGLMMGEILVFKNKALAEDFLYVRKQNTQLASKMRFISQQLLYFLDSSLYLSNATQANQMAQALSARIKALGLPIAYPVDANMVFFKLDKVRYKAFYQLEPIYMFDYEQDYARAVCSFDTTEAHIDRFISNLKQVLDN